MKTGRTGLAVWTGDGTLRMYELTESGFAQTWADSLAHQATAVSLGFFPSLAFIDADEEIFLMTSRVTGSPGILETWRIATGVRSYLERPTSGATPRSQMLYTNLHRLVQIPSGNQNAGAGWNGLGELGSKASGYGRLTGTWLASVETKSVLMSPNARVYITTFRSTGSDPWDTVAQFGTIDPVTQESSFSAPQGSGAIAFADGALFDASAFSHDGALFYGVDRTTGVVSVYSIDYDAESLTKVWEFREDPLGGAHNIAVSPDRRHVAISYNDEGTYSTVIYRRFGMVFQRYQELGSGIGRLLDFSGDGRLLIDAGLRSAYSYENGQFSEEVGLLSNVVSSGVQVQAVSHHVDIITSTSWFYDGSLLGLLEDTVDKQNLKLVLLDENATFDRTDATLAEVTNNGAYEVHGNGWPEGGVGLTGVGLQQGTIDSVMLAAEDVEQVIFGGNLSFWRAVIVEDGVPIIYTDFNQEVAVENGEQLTFSFESGIVVFST